MTYRRQQAAAECIGCRFFAAKEKQAQLQVDRDKSRKRINYRLRRSFENVGSILIPLVRTNRAGNRRAMEKLIYVVGIFHFIVAYILLMAVDRLSGYYCCYWKKLLFASISAIHGSICMIPQWSSLAQPIIRWGLLGIMGGLLYWRGGKLLPRLALLLLLNFGVDGFQRMASQDELLSFAAAGVAIAFICVFSFRDATSQRYISIELVYGSSHVSLTALVDTGNTLRDPVSGEPVLVISHKAAFQLTGLSRQQLSAPLETMEQAPISGLRLIPYHSIGKDNGMLLALRLPHCKIAGKEKTLLVAFAPTGLGKESSFQALVGGEL